MMAARHALAMGAAVLAAVPVVISPLTVSAATPMTPGEWIEYFAVSSDETLVAPLWAEHKYWPIYYTMVMNVYQLPYINGIPIDPSAFTFRAGYYLRGGERHRGCVTLWSRRYFQNGGASNAMPLFSGDDCSISLTVEPVTGNTSQMYYVDYDVDSSSHPRLYVASAYGRRNFQYTLAAPGFNTGTTSTTVTVMFNNSYLGQITGASPVEMSSNLDDVFGFTGYPSTQLLGNAVVMPSMPTSDAYPTITADNALDYIRDVLNPWAVEQSPDIEPYLFDPIEPIDPIYPTGETVQGMPKEWTVENPALPSYSLDLQLPTADFEAVDVSAPLEHHATGLRFWWALLGECLDHFGVKELVIFALALGLIITILTRLGR